MNTNDIILAIDAKIAQLQQAKALLKDADITIKRKQVRPADLGMPNKATSLMRAPSWGKTKRRTMSAEGRAKIAEAQKIRWAKSKKAMKNVAHKAASASTQKGMKAKAVTRKTAEAK